MRLIIFLSLTLGTISSFALNIHGEARKQKSQEIVYLEKHQIDLNDENTNRTIITEYFKPDGKSFAKMKTDFAKDSFLPDIEFTDSRFDLIERQVVNKLTKTVKLTKILKGAIAEEKELELKNNMVGGQGFDNFIRANFQKPTGDKLPMTFLVLSKMNSYYLEAQVKEAKTTEKEFSLSPSSLFFKIFAAPIKVTYNTATKRLSSYSGLSNILNDNGDSQSVDISYKEATP